MKSSRRRSTRPFAEWRSQGLFLHEETPLAWRRVGPERMLASLAPIADYNVRASRRGDALAVTASLPLFPRTLERRRDWLCDRLRRAAAALVAGGTPTLPTFSATPDGPWLDDVRGVAEGRGWAVSAEGDALVLSPTGPGPRIPLRVRDAGGEAWVCARLPSLAPRHPSVAVRSAVACAALGLNARFAFGRLRVADADRVELAVEGCVPREGRDEDEIEFALEGVRHAALEAMGTLECLRDEAVAREYAAAHQLSRP